MGVLAATFVALWPLRPVSAAERERFLTQEPTAEGPEEDAETPKDAPRPSTPPEPEAPAQPVPEERALAPARLGAGGELRVFGGMHQPTFGVAVMFDWAFRRAALGLLVDYAAWLSLDQLAMHPGALHVAATAQHRVPLGRLSLRQRLAVGPAILLAPKDSHAAGSTGLFFEAAPLGLEVHTRISRLAFVFEAFSLALSAPVLGPDPVIQTQYRATLGLRF